MYKCKHQYHKCKWLHKQHTPNITNVNANITNVKTERLTPGGRRRTGSKRKQAGQWSHGDSRAGCPACFRAARRPEVARRQPGGRRPEGQGRRRSPGVSRAVGGDRSHCPDAGGSPASAGRSLLHYRSPATAGRLVAYIARLSPWVVRLTIGMWLVDR